MQTSLATLADWGTEHLERVVAIDSASDETSTTIPSSEGQRKLAEVLAGMLRELGCRCDSDASANLIATIPASKGCEHKQKLALMVHMDTAHGTQAVPKLHVVTAWAGARIPYPKNDRLHVDAKSYPLLQAFVGDDVLHGPGDFPFGLDDKLGMAELLTLAKLLHQEPDIAHGELLLVFRPDEEIGRMEAVVGLAQELKRRGVTLGYTVDGLSPFEVNVENFDAARVRVRIPAKPLALPAGQRAWRVHVNGVNTHGATAKSEGYLNATTVFARANVGVPLAFHSDNLLECNAVVDVAGDESAIRAAFEAVVASAKLRGAGVAVSALELPKHVDDAALQLRALLTRFLDGTGPTPLLSEDSDGYEGYSNAHRAVRDGDTLVVDFRLRDFSRPALAKRAAHVVQCAAELGLGAVVEQQYVNMGPTLARFPDAPRLALEAAARAGVVPERRPIRGGTGVDPFLAVGIPVANVGTGYFAPESEKELTSRQNIARHAHWLMELVRA
ncbi:MAG TPA: hypothetical protein VGO62_17425 [Myxococcota bacterium]